MVNKFMKEVEEKWNKLTPKGKREFWYRDIALIKDPDAYQLALEVLEWENKVKEKMVMEDQKKVGVDVSKKGSEDTEPCLIITFPLSIDSRFSFNAVFTIVSE